jgi:N-acylneuraminate cytidylyltransferase
MSQINNSYFLIPARRGSKGLPFKNRKLFDYTVSTIPTELYNRVYVSTDDEHIKEESIRLGLNVIDRPEIISNDEASVKDVMLHFIDETKISPESDVVLMYLTYPERTWEDIVKIYDIFKSHNASSLICADEIIEHPYLCLYDNGDMKGELVIPHGLYRRQDYPKCFKHSLYVGCYKVSEINEINDLLINKKTLYFKLTNKKVDVDTYEDFKRLKK